MQDEKNGNDKDLPRGMHCILGAHPAVSEEAEVSSRPLLLRAEEPDRRGVEDAEAGAEVSATASEGAAESADRFCLLADPGPDDDPP